MTSILLSLAVAEGILRLSVELPLDKKYPQVRYDPHPLRRFTLRGEQRAFTYEAPVKIDAQGFRNHNDTADRGYGFTIFALGDSVTFGLGVADNQTWTSQLEVQLNNQTDMEIGVINGGTTSYGVFQEMNLFLEKGLPMKPDIVIHALYWNDYMSAGPPLPGEAPALTDEGYFVWDEISVPSGAFSRALAWLSGHSAFVYSGKRVLQMMRGNQPTGVHGYEDVYRRFIAGDVDPEQWRPIETFYRELKSLGNSNGFRVVSVILPVQGLASYRDTDNHPFVTYVREVLNKLDIPYLDCIKIWQERALWNGTFLPYNRHLNDKGYRVIADELAAILQTEVRRPRFRAEEKKNR